MRQPLWLVNSSLFLLFIVALFIAIISQQKPLRWSSIEPTAYTKIIKKEVSKTEIAKIYENDLFGTYQKTTVVEPEKEEPIEDLLPAPPTPQAAALPQPPKPTFLDPLQATLRGIIIIGDDRKDRVIMERDATKEEVNLKIGDRFEDAQLIAIFKNRALFIRSNGQEETLYLTEKDANLSPEGLGQERWEGIIQKTSSTSFNVDPEGFVEYVPSLAQFIDELDLITVYRKGQPLGTRIGKVEPGSFAEVFGLQVGDIITNVQGISATDISKRLDIYKKVTSLSLGKTITIDLIRHNKEELQLSIKLQELDAAPSTVVSGMPMARDIPEKTQEDIEQEKADLMHKKYSFAPTVQDMKKREKQTILKKVHKKELQQKKETSSKFEL